jgi:hypothetical protein
MRVGARIRSRFSSDLQRILEASSSAASVAKSREIARDKSKRVREGPSCPAWRNSITETPFGQREPLYFFFIFFSAQGTERELFHSDVVPKVSETPCVQNELGLLTPPFGVESLRRSSYGKSFSSCRDPTSVQAMDTKAIQDRLRRVKQRLRGGDESEFWIWVIEARLACAQRPLRYDPRFPERMPLPPEARPLVELWVNRILGVGFRSIISLLEDAQLDRHYVRGGLDLHPKGLLGYYRHRGLEVASIPCTDYQRPSDDKMREALAAFRRLPKPILLHCSGGIDRSSPVAEYLSEHDERPSEK